MTLNEAQELGSASENGRTVIRAPEIAGPVVFVDGLPGCGKTMMTPIVGSLARVELMQYVFELEYVCALRFLDKMSDDVATTLIRMFTDLRLYNVMQSRETNFRWNDLSSPRLHARPWRYLLRLFLPGDEAAIERIRRERPILHLVTHLLLAISSPLFVALGDRARVVEVVRHPLYMIKQQFKYMPRWGTDARDFSIWFQYEERALPWFARGWEKKFTDSCPMDQAIFMIEEMQRLRDKLLCGVSERQRAQILIIPFERFVTDPWPYLRRLEALLDSRVTPATRRILRQQNVPRKMYAEGIGRKIYREYGWQPPAPGSSEAVEFHRRREFAAERATPEAMEVLGRLCAEYEERYLSTALSS